MGLVDAARAHHQDEMLAALVAESETAIAERAPRGDDASSDARAESL